MNFLKEFFSSWLNWLFILLFIGAAFCYVTYFYKRISAKSELLARSATILGKYNQSNIQSYYGALDAELAADEILKPVWAKYKKSLAFIPKDNAVTVYSTVDASEYLYPAALLGGLNTGFWSGLAGLFTGIGILGTFFGLTVGLAGIDTSSTSNLSNSITGLLGGMSTAFVTSLIGIVFAIPSGFFYHRQMDKFQGEVGELANALDEIFQRTNAETIMLSQLEEIRQERAAIQSLSTQMAVALCDRLPDVLEQMADRMDQAVKGNLDTMLEGLSAKLDEQTGRLDDMALKLGDQTDRLDGQLSRMDDQQRELEKVAENTKALASGYGEAINEGAGEQAKVLGNSLERLSKDINGLSDGIMQMIAESKNTAANANAEMIEAVERAVSRLDVTMEGIMAKQTEKTDENIQKMTDLMGEMKETMANIFAKMVASTKEQSDTNTKAGEDLKKAIEAAGQATADNLEQMNDGIKSMMASIAAQLTASANEQSQKSQEASDGVAAAVTAAGEATKENLAHINDTVKELLEEIAKQMVAMQQLMNTQEKRMDATLLKMNEAVSSSGDVVEQAGRTVKEFDGAAKNTRNQFTLAAKEAAETIKGAAVPFNEAARPLKDAAASLNGGLKTLSTAMDAHNNSATKVSKQLQDTAEEQRLAAMEIEDSLKTIQKSWQAYESHFKTVDTSMAKVFNNLQSGLENYNKATNQGLTDKLKAFDKELSGAIKDLANINADTGEMVLELTDAVKKMRR